MGLVSSYNYCESWRLAHLPGYSHPLHVSTHIHHDSATPVISQSTHQSLPWPKCNDGSQSENHVNQIMHQGGFWPIVVLKFVSNREIQPDYGYQEAHKMYDEMCQSFARMALSTHQNEVVVIKVTMMSLKPGYKNPQMVSVWNKSNLLALSWSSNPNINLSEHIRNHVKHPSVHWCQRPQVSHILYLATSIRQVVQKLCTLDQWLVVAFQRMGQTDSLGTWWWRHQCNFKQVFSAKRKIESATISIKQGLGSISGNKLWGIYSSVGVFGGAAKWKGELAILLMSLKIKVSHI